MNRKWIGRIVAALLCAATLCTPAFAATVGGAEVHTSNTGLNLRSQPSTGAAVLDQVPDGTFLLVEEKLDGWYKVVYNGVSGYVSADYADFSQVMLGTYRYTAETTGTNVNMRWGDSTGYGIAKCLSSAGTKLTVIGVSGNWLKVRDESGTEGWVRSDFVKYSGSAAAAASPAPAQTTAVVNAAAPAAAPVNASYSYASSGNAAADAVVQTAMQFLGYRYVWGGMSPSGFDCSGFVNYVYQQHGISMKRVAQDIYSYSGTLVTDGNLQPGDVLCFGWSAWSIGHVGLYIGNGKMIHAANSSSGVIISDITSGYYHNRLVGAKRFL